MERFQQTLKKWLRAQPPTATLTDLHTQLDAFREDYNHQRQHRSLAGRIPEIGATRAGTSARRGLCEAVSAQRTGQPALRGSLEQGGQV